MGIQSKIGSFVRWALTWPVLVIVALNLENAASEAGYSMVINRHWKDTVPVLSELYSWAVSPLIWYPALIFWGAAIYEWVRHLSNEMEAKGSRYRIWLLKMIAESAAPAFLKNGLARKMIKKDRDLTVLNARLAGADLPQVPITFSDDESVNAIYGSYLTLVANRQFEHAKAFLEQANLTRDC